MMSFYIDLKMKNVFTTCLFMVCCSCASKEQQEQETLQVLQEDIVEVESLKHLMLSIENPSIVSPETGEHNLVLKNDGKSAKAEILAAMSEKQWELAISLIRSFLSNYPGNPEAVAYLSSAYLAMGDLAKADFYSNLVLKSDPKNSVALNIKGIVTWKQGEVLEDHRKALAFFNVASQSSSRSLGPALNLAFMQLRLGNLESSWSEFKKAEKVCTQCIMPKIGIAMAAQRLGNYEESEESLKEALDLDEENPLVAYLMAVYHLEGHSDSEAGKEWAEKVIDSSRSDYELQEKARELITDL